MAFIQTIGAGFIPKGYFTEKNVESIKEGIKKNTISYGVDVDLLVDDSSIARIMQRVLEERLESVPKMNQRVVMYIVNDFLNHQLDVNKKLRWGERYTLSQRLYDPSSRRGPDIWGIKLNTNLDIDRVGGSVRFYFT